MEAKELRIGNYVSTPFGDFIIRQQDLNNDIISESGIKPIPLTEEWLLKFGFVKLGDGFEFWESSVFNIEFIRNHWHVCYTSKVLCIHIKHVHQLQNLYFALTGEELTLSK